MKLLIYETKNFVIATPELPLVTREDGGHIEISPKTRINNRTLLTPQLSIEMMRLTMLVGEAMTIGLKNRGINIERINYQDNGNWGVFKPDGPFLHIHLYGRATNAKIQKYGHACQFPMPESGFYDDFEALTNEDIIEIKSQINALLETKKYMLSSWNNIEI